MLAVEKLDDHDVKNTCSLNMGIICMPVDEKSVYDNGCCEKSDYDNSAHRALLNANVLCALSHEKFSTSYNVAFNVYLSNVTESKNPVNEHICLSNAMNDTRATKSEDPGYDRSVNTTNRSYYEIPDDVSVHGALSDDVNSVHAKLFDHNSVYTDLTLYDNHHSFHAALCDNNSVHGDDENSVHAPFYHDHDNVNANLSLPPDNHNCGDVNLSLYDDQHSFHAALCVDNSVHADDENSVHAPFFHDHNNVNANLSLIDDHNSGNVNLSLYDDSVHADDENNSVHVDLTLYDNHHSFHAALCDNYGVHGDDENSVHAPFYHDHDNVNANLSLPPDNHNCGDVNLSLYDDSVHADDENSVHAPSYHDHDNLPDDHNSGDVNLSLYDDHRRFHAALCDDDSVHADDENSVHDDAPFYDDHDNVNAKLSLPETNHSFHAAFCDDDSAYAALADNNNSVHLVLASTPKNTYAKSAQVQSPCRANDIRCVALNVSGLNAKLRNGVLDQYLSTFDIVSLVETNTDSPVISETLLNSYSCFTMKKSNSTCK